MMSLTNMIRVCILSVFTPPPTKVNMSINSNQGMKRLSKGSRRLQVLGLLGQKKQWWPWWTWQCDTLRIWSVFAPPPKKFWYEGWAKTVEGWPARQVLGQGGEGGWPCVPASCSRQGLIIHSTPYPCLQHHHKHQHSNTNTNTNIRNNTNTYVSIPTEILTDNL